MRHSSIYRTFVTLSLGVLVLKSGPCFAEENPWWNVPKDAIKVDLGSRGRDCRASFTNSGLEFEVVVQFSMVGRSEIPLEAKLPEDGSFEAKITTPSGAVDVANLRVEGRTGKAEVKAKYEIADLPRLRDQALTTCLKLLEPGIKQAQETAKSKSLKAGDFKAYLSKRGHKPPEDEGQLLEAYCRAWAGEHASQPAKDFLEKFSTERPSWLSAAELQRLQSRDGSAMMDRCRELIAFDLADKYLRACGVECDATGANYRTVLEPKVNAVYVILSGKTREQPNAGKVIAAALSRKDQINLHRNFNIRLSCRFRPNVDPRDGNAQWFDAQRVVSRASGASLIRVEGRLSPAQGDRCDWWFLDRYSEAAVQLELPKEKGIRVEKYPANGSLRLRVVAIGDAPVDYKFQLQPTKSSSTGATLILFESPDSPLREFPY